MPVTFPPGTPLGKIEETTRVAHDIIQAMDDRAMKSLMGGYQNDIDRVMDDLLKETYAVLYGNSTFSPAETSLQYIDGLTDVFEETLRCDSMNYFITTVFDDVEVNWHHYEWGSLIETFDQLVIEAARNHGKTWFFNVLYNIWKMYRYNPTGPQSQRARVGLMLGSTYDKAVESMEKIVALIENNDILKNRIFKKNPKGGKKGVKSDRIEGRNGVDMKANGLFGRIRGAHPDWIVCDDVLNDDMLYSLRQRDKAIELFFGVVKPMLNPGGQIILVGTPFHMNDLFGAFRNNPERGKHWIYREYPSIFPNGALLWENRFDFKQLMQLRDEQGSLMFSREYLCRPVSSDSSIFPWNILNNAITGMKGYTLVNSIDAFPLKFKNVVIGCDFAMSATVGADFTVYTVWGVYEEKQDDGTVKDIMYLLHVWRKQGASFNEQITRIKLLNQAFRPDVVIMEANNFQNIYTQFLQNSNIPVKPHTTGTNKADYRIGVPSMQVLFERHQIRIPYGNKESVDTADLMMTEFNNVTYTDNKGIQAVGSHDDTVMSSWFGTIGLRFMRSGKINVAYI